MKILINSPLMKWFRKSFLKAIYFQILHNKKRHCCHVRTWHSLFVCWKDLKEVKQNMTSKQLRNWKSYTCKLCWFDNKEKRLDFLKECIQKL
jgi:hypothetical protein